MIFIVRYFVKVLIKENVPFELIAKCSKLTVEKVRQIAKEHNLLVEKSI
ncbi:MAG: hypothetical protein SPF26_06890 [Succinivibrio sp.]|nr:hypothetical protein [Succinivibrio sp.]